MTLPPRRRAGLPLPAARAGVITVVAFSALAVLAACSSGTKSAAAPGASVNTGGSAANAQGGGTDTGGAAGGGEKAGAEGAAVAFTHPTLHYRIDAPGTMTATPDGGASYKGPTDFLTVAVVKGPGDPTSLATTDSSGAGVQGFKLVVAPHSVTVSGLKGSALEFTEAAGTSAITGKAQMAHVVRVYLPRPDGAYRIDYGSTLSGADWDPQGAMDVITTFKAAA